MRLHRKLGLLAGFIAVVLVGAVSSASAGSRTAAVEPKLINDAQLKAMTTTMGGADVLPTTRTIPHWWADARSHQRRHLRLQHGRRGPEHLLRSACSVTIQVDITPIIVNVGGLTFNGTDVVAATLASPQFATNDYGSTPAATARCVPNASLDRGPGGALSQGDAGNPLQLQDATMRAQFNKTGASSYHSDLHPNVLPAVTINVPQNQGTLLQSGRGVIFADIDISWWSAQIKNLETTADPTHLPIYLTNNVLLYIGKDVLNCCVIGFHGTGRRATAAAAANSQRQRAGADVRVGLVRPPGIYARPNGGTDWALQDIHALSHEIAEWADDPFVNNLVEPWLTPTAPQYGCTDVLETGDPVVGDRLRNGHEHVPAGPNPNGTQSADGYYHPEDEVFLPWFMRTAPNTVSEPTQSPSTNVGRYTLMGDLTRSRLPPAGDRLLTPHQRRESPQRAPSALRTRSRISPSWPAPARLVLTRLT